MIANLEYKQSEVEEKISQLTVELEAGKDDAENIKKQIGSLERQHAEVLNSLADKRQKLMEANKKLAEFRDLEERTIKQVKEYQQQATEIDMATLRKRCWRGGGKQRGISEKLHANARETACNSLKKSSPFSEKTARNFSETARCFWIVAGACRRSRIAGFLRILTTYRADLDRISDLRS